MITGASLGRVGGPPPAARPSAKRGAHGVARPAQVPIATGSWYDLDWCRIYFCVSGALAFLMAASLGGCITRSQAEARARAAYRAGQNDAFAKMSADQRNGVFIVGPVQKSEVPWVAGLTLTQAIATANYIGHTPREITITRQGEQASVDPKDLLNGHVVPLEPGDTITIRE